MISDSIVFSSRSELSNLPAGKLVDGMFYALSDYGWYQYHDDGTDDEGVYYDGYNPGEPYYAIQAVNGTGKFYLMNPAAVTIVGDSSPDGVKNAPFPGQIYIDESSSPTLWIQNVAGTSWTYGIPLLGGGGS